MGTFVSDMRDDDETTFDVVKVECSKFYADCYVRSLEDLQNTMEYMLGEPDCWGDAAVDFKVTLSFTRMTESEFAALESWEDVL